MSATVVADASIIIPLDGKANPRAIVKTRTARAASLFVVSSLFIAVQPARALGIVLTNDDGFESALTYALYQRLLEAGHRVLISASTADQSGRGGSLDFLRPVGPLTAATRGGCVVPPASPATPGVGNLALGAPFVVTDCPSDPNVFWVTERPSRVCCTASTSPHMPGLERRRTS